MIHLKAQLANLKQNTSVIERADAEGVARHFKAGGDFFRRRRSVTLVLALRRLPAFLRQHDDRLIHPHDQRAGPRGTPHREVNVGRLLDAGVLRDIIDSQRLLLQSPRLPTMQAPFLRHIRTRP